MRLKTIKQQEIPLALYIFTADMKKVDYALKYVRSGGVCINDCLYHNTNPALPFGGLGASGQGKYHGVAGFEEFTHSRAVMFRPTFIDPAVRYPPYSDKTVAQFKSFMVFPPFGRKTRLFFKAVKYFAIVGLAVYICKHEAVRSRFERLLH